LLFVSLILFNSFLLRLWFWKENIVKLENIIFIKTAFANIKNWLGTPYISYLTSVRCG